MWLRSDKRELRNRNQAKEKFANHRKKRKRSRNQYCKTIKLMKASVLTTKQYSADELTLYNDKALNAKKHQHQVAINTSSNNKKNLTFTSDSSLHSVNQYHHSYDLNNIDIDLNIRTSSIDDVSDENAAIDLHYASTEHFQPLNTQQYDDDYDVECNYAKTTSEIHAVSNMLISKSFIYLLCRTKLN